MGRCWFEFGGRIPPVAWSKDLDCVLDFKQSWSRLCLNLYVGGGIKCCVVFNPTCEDTMVHKQSRHVSNVPKRAGS